MNKRAKLDSSVNEREPCDQSGISDILSEELPVANPVDTIDDDGIFEAGPLRNEVVLQNLFSIMDLKSLKTCRRVCKTWRDVMDPIFKSRVTINFTISNSAAYLMTLSRRHSTPTYRRHPDLSNKLWRFDLMMKGHTSLIPFTSFKFEGTKISWTCLIMQNFFKRYGSQIKKLKINLLWQILPLINFFECIFLICKYASGLEVLDLQLISDDGENDERNIPCEKVYFQPEVLGKLKRFSFYYRLNNSTELERDLLSAGIVKLVSSSKSLTHYEIKSTLNLFTSKTLTKESYCSLKNLSLSQVCMYRNSNSGINESVFELLLNYTNRGLKLEEFYVEFWIWEDDNSNLAGKFHLLSKFLQSQSKCLKTLKISPVCQCIKPLTWFFPTFPKMEKLQDLQIIYDDTTENYFTFEDSNLGRPFPHLKTILFSYKTIMNNTIISSLLNTFEMSGDELTFVRINENFLSTRYFFDLDMMSACVKHFREAKLKIPNLKSLKIRDDTIPESPRIACYNGCPEDSYVVF